MPRKSQPFVSTSVAAQRSRYYEALRQGHTTKDAARVAAGEAVPLSDKPAGKLPRLEPITHAIAPPSDAQGVDAAPRADPPNSVGTAVVTIPDNWHELPWPALRELATTLGFGAITNRVEAHAAIAAVLESRLIGDS